MGLAKDSAAALSVITQQEHGQKTLEEREYGKQHYEEGLGNPADYAHLVIDSYAQAAGDLLHGAAEVSRTRHDLAFSSAAVARSSCEYAGIGWWLADPTISPERRISRTASELIRSVDSARGILDRAEFAEYEVANAQRLAWAKRQPRRERMPNKTARFVLMNPEAGKFHYNHLSLLAHGDLDLTVGIVQAKMNKRDLGQEPIWRILLACGYGLTFAGRLGELRQCPTNAPALFQRVLDYADLLD